MALILPFNGKTPRVHESAFIAPNATLIGDVEIGPQASVFYGCVLRADSNRIKVGARTNIQDNSVLHVDADADCVLGDDVTIGHMALVHEACGQETTRGEVCSACGELLAPEEMSWDKPWRGRRERLVAAGELSDR